MPPVAALALLLLSASAHATPSPSCREGFACPNRPGRVEVTVGAFDGSGATGNAAGVLDADEIQCAIDCLEGDPDPDHVLAGPKAPRTATPVRGGSIVLDPSATYRVQRSLRLPAISSGSVLLDGQGARLEIRRAGPEPIAVLERRAPPGANNCDVELMSTWAMAWVVENVIVTGDGSPRDVGLVMDGTNSLTVRNSWFASLGVGVEIRFGLMPAIEQCMFLNNRRHDVIVGDGRECAAPEHCFGSCVAGATAFPEGGSDTRQLADGGSNGAVVRHCRFLMHPQQLSSVRIRGSRAVVVDGPMFDGVRGRHAIHHSDHVANDLSVRDVYFETNVERPEAIIRFDGGSRLILEGLYVVSSVPVVAVDAADNADAAIVVRGLSWMPPQVRFANGPNPWRNQWRFEDVLASDLTTPARWAGGPPPRSMVVDDVRESSRPEGGALRSLTVPIGSPLQHGETLQPGQIWLDRDTNRLMVCCDQHGRPQQAR